jgi:hypothetical protein
MDGSPRNDRRGCPCDRDRVRQHAFARVALRSAKGVARVPTTDLCGTASASVPDVPLAGTGSASVLLLLVVLAPPVRQAQSPHDQVNHFAGFLPHVRQHADSIQSNSTARRSAPQCMWNGRPRLFLKQRCHEMTPSPWLGYETITLDLPRCQLLGPALVNDRCHCRSDRLGITKVIVPERLELVVQLIDQGNTSRNVKRQYFFI